MVDAFLEYLTLEKKYSAHTITAYKNDLQSFKKFLEMEYAQENLREVHYSQIRNWIVNLVDIKVSNRTVNRKVSALKSFFTFLQKTKQIDYNPLSKHKSLKIEKRLQVPFSFKEINTVINDIDKEANDDFESLRNRLIVELFYSTGIRRAELINIKQRDVSFSDKTIKILGKRNKERFVPLLGSVIQTLNRYLALKKEFEIKNKAFAKDSMAAVTLDSYKANHLKYISNNSNEGLAVFSEMYYPYGWKARIDGVEAPLKRTETRDKIPKVLWRVILEYL